MRGLRRSGVAPLRFAPIERAWPTPTADEALVAVEAAWLDLGPRRVATGDVDVADGDAAIGRVTAAGAEAAHLIGRRVLVAAVVPCGECDVCRRGGVAACPAGAALARDRDGALAEAIAVRGRWLCPLTGGLEDGTVAIDAAMGALIAGPAALAYSMYARAGLTPGQPVVVVGDGPAAAIVERVAAAKGARPVRTSPGASPDVAIGAVAAVAAGDRRPRTIFDLGEPGGLALAASLADPAATVVALARPDEASLDLAPLLARGVAVLGVAGPHPDLLAELAALVARGELALADLAEVVPWRDLDEDATARAAGQRAAGAGRALVAIF